MSKAIPNVGKFMTPAPHTIGHDQSLLFAQRQMSDHKIRHLPVLEAGRLVGVLTERDVALITALKDVDPTKVAVSDAMSQQVYTVSPTTPLDDVAADMAANKYGSAVVMDNDKVVGVFTTVDGMAALHDLLRTRLAK